jgi:hypothetical protein
MPASSKSASLHLEQIFFEIVVNNAGLGQLFEPCEERLPQAKQMPVRHAQRAVA